LEQNIQFAGNESVPDLSRDIERKMPLFQSFLYGLQHVFVSNVWLDPLFIAAMVGMPLAMASNLVNAIFIAAGLVTLTQATRLARLPIVQGPSAAFDSLMITSGKANGLSAAGGAILISAVAVFIMSVTGLLGKLQKFFTPVVSGTVICVVGIALSHFTMFEFLGGSPGMPGFLSGPNLLLSITTAVIVILLSNFGKGLWKSYGFLIALVIGDLLSVFMGKTDFSVISQKGWFGLPQLFPYGAFTWDAGIILTFFIAYLVAVIEAMGVYHAAAEMVDIKLDSRRIKLAFTGESVGSMISSVLGGTPTTAYAQNVGLLRLTGVGSRFPVIMAGVIFLVLGFVPKAGAVLALTPDAVVGGLFLPAAAGLLMSGITILVKMPKTEANFTIAGLSLLLAIALPENFTQISGIWGTILTNSILVGACSAIFLQLFLVHIPLFLRRSKS
jgi:uracil-xanthine permease